MSAALSSLTSAVVYCSSLSCVSKICLTTFLSPFEIASANRWLSSFSNLYSVGFCSFSFGISALATSSDSQPKDLYHSLVVGVGSSFLISVDAASFEGFASAATAASVVASGVGNSVDHASCANGLGVSTTVSCTCSVFVSDILDFYLLTNFIKTYYCFCHGCCCRPNYL